MLNPKRIFSLTASLIISLVFTLSGCAVTPKSEVSPFHDYSNLEYLPTEFGQQLAESSIGQKFTAAISPWGVNKEIVILNRFFAASGRNCAEISIIDASQLAVVCKYQTRWVLNPDILPR